MVLESAVLLLAGTIGSVYAVENLVFPYDYWISVLHPVCCILSILPSFSLVLFWRFAFLHLDIGLEG